MVSVNKYIIDTSAMLSQKSDEQYRRTVYKSLPPVRMKSTIVVRLLPPVS